MRTSLKLISVVLVFAGLVVANEWHRKRERVKQAEAYAEAVVGSSARDWEADGIFPASIQTDIIRVAEHELTPIVDTESRRAFAATYFFMAWLPVGEILPEVCEEKGVNIRAFADAYESIHRDALERSRALLTKPYEEESSIRKRVQSKLREGVAGQLQDQAESSGRTVEEECKALNAEGATLAARSNMATFATKIYAALYAGK